MIIFNSKKGYGTSPLFEQTVFHGFGTKNFGNGQKNETINTLLKRVHIQPQIVIPQQTHSTSVKIIDAGHHEGNVIYVPNVDGLVSENKNVLLTVVTADCVPIIYADFDHSVIGISHGGWSGTLQNISQNVIDQMIELGARKESIFAAMGPAISDCCYEVYGDRYEQFKKRFSSEIISSIQGKHYLNLAKANRESLLATGISAYHIDHSLFCTECEDDLFWSFHRDKRIEGEMLHFVMIR